MRCTAGYSGLRGSANKRTAGLSLWRAVSQPSPMLAARPGAIKFTAWLVCAAQGSRTAIDAMHRTDTAHNVHSFIQRRCAADGTHTRHRDPTRTDADHSDRSTRCTRECVRTDGHGTAHACFCHTHAFLESAPVHASLASLTWGAHTRALLSPAGALQGRPCGTGGAWHPTRHGIPYSMVSHAASQRTCGRLRSRSAHRSNRPPWRR